jgi:PhzF family phenazine biosynthesis protein
MGIYKIYQVDTFTERLFCGNPAAVVFLKEWIDDRLMQAMAAENNLAETAFVVPQTSAFRIRWFTPTVEVDLCGHATLASAFVLYNVLKYQEREIYFFSPRSGQLTVEKRADYMFMDFPSDILEDVDHISEIQECINIEPIETYKGKTDYIAVLQSESDVQNLKPDLKKISELNGRGLIVTAEGSDVDFVSRFFAPQSGIDEDPVTGSAHTSLIPLWSAILDKEELTARQLSPRGGFLKCINHDERCLIGGKAKLYMSGEIFI